MITLKYEKLIPSRNQLEWMSGYIRKNIKKSWQKNTVKQLEGHEEKFHYLIMFIKIYFKTKKNRDMDNYLSSLAVKGIIDGIVEYGMIEDDDAEHLNYSIDLLVDKQNSRTEVILYGSEEGNEYLK